MMQHVLLVTLNGLVYGLLLFMLSSGLTLIVGMMGVLNFAHASFYMLGAYFAYAISTALGFWAALLLAPLAVGALGMAVERYGLRSVHRHGHVAELLFTVGLAFIIAEVVPLVWGRSPVPYAVPEALSGAAFRLGPRRVAPRKPSAHHKLHLVENHQRQHRHADARAGEQDIGHRDAARQGFFRAAKDNRHLIGAGKSKGTAGKCCCQQHRAEQRAIDRDQHGEARGGQLVPDAMHHRFAEGDIDDEQDRAAIGDGEDPPVAQCPGADPGPQNLPGDERQQQLEHDLADLVERHPAAMELHQERHQDRREKNTDEVGGGRGADRRRHIAVPDRGEGDRGLHRRG